MSPGGVAALPIRRDDPPSVKHTRPNWGLHSLIRCKMVVMLLVHVLLVLHWCCLLWCWWLSVLIASSGGGESVSR